MKIITLLLTLSYILMAEIFVLYSEKIHEQGTVFWVITACKDNYRYTIVKEEPVDIKNIEQDFNLIKQKDYRFPCPNDIKHPSQFPKD